MKPPLLEALGEQGKKFGLLGETRCESRGLRKIDAGASRPFSPFVNMGCDNINL